MQTWGFRLSHLPPDSSGGLRVPAVVPYLPGLDGLRALAVVAVIFYHANHSWLEGGFLGVEVFFVISGYLITLLLVRVTAHGHREFARILDTTRTSPFAGAMDTACRYHCLCLVFQAQ